MQTFDAFHDPYILPLRVFRRSETRVILHCERIEIYREKNRISLWNAFNGTKISENRYVLLVEEDESASMTMHLKLLCSSMIVLLQGYGNIKNISLRCWKIVASCSMHWRSFNFNVVELKVFAIYRENCNKEIKIFIPTSENCTLTEA